MTRFQTLLQGSGFTGSEAADFLNIKHATLRSWAGNRRNCPDDIIRAFLPVAKANCEQLYSEICRIENDLEN